MDGQTDGRIGQKNKAPTAWVRTRQTSERKKIVRGEHLNWVALTLWIFVTVSGDRSEHKTLIRCSRQSCGFASTVQSGSRRQELSSLFMSTYGGVGVMY